MPDRRDRTPIPGRMMSASDRDLAALKRRRQQLDDGTVTGEITVGDEEEITRPTDIALERYENDPAFRLLWDRVSKIKNEERQALKTLGNTTLEVHQQQQSDPGLEIRVARLESTLAVAKWLIGFLIAAVLGSVVLLATKIFTWGVGTGEIEIRLRHIERDMETYHPRKGQTP